MTEPSRGRVRRLPWWLGAIAGLLVAFFGAFLLVRPFQSVGLFVTLLGVGLVLAGAAEVVRAFLPGIAAWWRLVLGGLVLALGIVVAVHPGLTVGVLVLLVGIVPIGLAIAELIRALGPDGGSRPEQVAGVLGAATGVLLGIAALAWPDVTVFALGFLFGGWLVILGLRMLAGAWLRRPNAQPSTGRRRRPWLRLAGLALGLLVAIAVTVAGVRLAGTPVPDAFYAVPSEVPDAPGQLIRAEPFDRAVPDGAIAWRILYTTTREDGVPAVASGLVVVPDATGPHPVIAWAHGTTGVAIGCAPSLLEDPFTAGAMPDLDEAIAKGWAIVATDYVGLGVDAPHPYVVGEAEGRSVLDAVRAAKQLDEVSLDPRIAIWGHSQGGGAALWAGGLAARYAPELDVVGVAAMAPASNLPAFIASFASNPVASILGGFVLYGYSGAYPDVTFDDYVRPQARIVVDAMARRCFTDPATLVSALEAEASDVPVWRRDPTQGPLETRAEENVPTLPIAAPLLIAQGLADPLIAPAAQQQYVDERCAAGQAIDYRTYAGKDHMGVVTGDSPLLGELLDWTEARFAGEPATPTC